MREDDRMTVFIHSLGPGNAPYLDGLEHYAEKTDVPVIRKQMQSLLRLLLTVKKPMRILEVGTAIGFSALMMCEYAPAECEMVTIEKYGKRILQAKENFMRYGANRKLTLMEGDAAEILPELQGEFDFIFMDAAKGQYMEFLPEVLRLLKKDGILVSDNVLQEGEILESRYGVKRRNRTIHGRMREYLYELCHREELHTEVLAVGDGVAVSYKK